MAIDFEIPPEAKAIRETVRKWVHDECIPAQEKLLKGADYKETLGALRKACQGTENTMGYIVECVKAYCTVQEICDVMRKEFGIYRDPGMF